MRLSFFANKWMWNALHMLLSKFQVRAVYYSYALWSSCFLLNVLFFKLIFIWQYDNLANLHTIFVCVICLNFNIILFEIRCFWIFYKLF